MRVLHVAESVKGGCGTYLNEIVPAQLTMPEIEAVRVIVPLAHANQVKQIAPEFLRTFGPDVRSFRAFCSLAKILREEVSTFQPDVVHLHSTFAGLLGRLLLSTRLTRPSIVYCAHGWAFDMDRAGWKKRVYTVVERVLAPLADKIIAISEHERRRGIEAGISAVRIITILNGLADYDVKPASAVFVDGRLRLLFIGRLDRQKGFDVLLQAIDGLEHRVSLRVIGASVVGDQMDGSSLPPHVTMLGWCTQSEIAAELAAADLLVVPSRWEGFGLVALEAMRAARPVLASSIGGLPEVVEDGITGRLVPADNPDELKRALIALDPVTLRRMGEAGRVRYLERFTIERTLSGLLRAYRTLQV